MRSFFLIVSMALCLSATNAAAQQCGEYVILGCFRDPAAAQNQLSRLGEGQVVDTSSGQYPNFRPGWFCIANGPYIQTHGLALDNKRFWQSNGVPDAYIKNAC